MHENQCSEPVCWLKDFCNQAESTLPAPKFCIGQAVNVQWFSEDCDRTMTDQGVIVGLSSKLPEMLIPGWCYCIQFTHMAMCDWLAPGYVDWVHESEIRVGGTM